MEAGVILHIRTGHDVRHVGPLGGAFAALDTKYSGSIGPI